MCCQSTGEAECAQVDDSKLGGQGAATEMLTESFDPIGERCARRKAETQQWTNHAPCTRQRNGLPERERNCRVPGRPARAGKCLRHRPCDGHCDEGESRCGDIHRAESLAFLRSLRMRRSARAPSSPTVPTKRASAASRSCSWDGTWCMSAAVCSGRLSLARERGGRTPRSRATNPFFSSRRSTGTTVVVALWGEGSRSRTSFAESAWSLDQRVSMIARSSSPRLCMRIRLPLIRCLFYVVLYYYVVWK